MFCPMGPIAVPAAALPSTLRVQTYVNGEKRQDGSTSSLITSIPKIIETISEGITLQAGDVIATGTPAGVGMGFRPPKFLKPGDLVEVSITGLGKLSNRIMQAKESNPTLGLVSHPSASSLPTFNLDRTWGGVGLIQAGDAFINVRELGSDSGAPIVFIHGLGASLEYWMPLIESTGLASQHRIIAYDLEGHGLSPAKASNTTTIDTYVRDLESLFMAKGITRATLVGWSLGALIAMAFAAKHSYSTSQPRVEKLILLGPGTNPLPSTASDMFAQRASIVRSQGMSASGIAHLVAKAATSPKTKSERPQATSSIRQFLLSTHPEGYAKGCMALALSKEQTVDVEKIDVPTLIVAGKDDQISTLETAESYVRRLRQGQVKVLEGVGHWHVCEDLGAVAQVVRQFA
ncbi:hypothetical protein N7510_006953 [Penicillium lagena]|uniref:uncharacterized protein n=1 Tax=Penicillium lagena TaxID=94218 RepID=UPI002541A71D|nr:uncharacterized protein N7510_006953 [Penicillium lagena]KAJ5610234.1 hypothetical protein N7510_006953 [Penicillium lagena]